MNFGWDRIPPPAPPAPPGPPRITVRIPVGCDSAPPDDLHVTDTGQKRTFASGATRDTATDKLDYEGFLSPQVVEAYGRYMHKNRKMADGSLRDSDNWQKGIPQPVYMKSAWRHFMDWWKAHRAGDRAGIEEACCAMLFNVMGYLYEHLRSVPGSNEGA